MFDDHVPTQENDEDLAAARENAGERVRMWRVRSICAVGVFLLSCALVAPFSKGGPLHEYAEPFGRVFVYLALGSFLALTYCAALLWGAWSALRDLRRP
jgi:hypothetical protein